jgi:type IV secretory pathway VirB10-like protein
MRRSPWLSLAVCALLAACQPSGPSDNSASSDSTANADVIDAVPLQTETAPVPTPAKAEAPAAPTPAPEKEQQATIPEGPDMAPQPVPISETPCRETIGAAASARLVERCIQVSPATRPPCNAANPCDLIQGEIDRSCKLWERDGDPPAACKP